MNRILTQVSALLLVGCANSMEPIATAAVPASAIQSSYRVSGTPKRPWDTQIDFYGDRFVYSQISSPHSGESGGALRFAQNKQTYYAVDLPFFAPKQGASSWTTDRYKCSSNHGRDGFLISCESRVSGAHFNSLYIPGKGLLWFDFFCQSFTEKICRYELQSKNGLFAHVGESALEKWSKYQDPLSMRGLQTKPIDVQFGDGGIRVNGKSMNSSSALKLLERSRDLSPRPNLVVSIERKRYESAVPFLRAISDQHLCDEIKCQYRLVDR